MPPGLDELFSLLQIKRHHESGDFDVIIVDCAPTGETLRLLSFPDVARWWLEKVFPWEKRARRSSAPVRAHAARRAAARATTSSRTSSGWCRTCRDERDPARPRAASIRLVMNPERMVVKEAQRTFTYLNLYGYLTDAVVVNRVFPEDVDDGYFGAWRAVQQEQIELVEQAFAPVPVLKAPFFEQEVIGPADARPAGAPRCSAPASRRSCSTSDLSQELEMNDAGAKLRLRCRSPRSPTSS